MAFTTYVINLDDQPGRYQAQSSALLALDIYPVRVSGWRHEWMITISLKDIRR